MHHRSPSPAFVACLLSIAVLPAVATAQGAPVYRCDPTGGRPTVFSQFPCTDTAEAMHIEPAQTFTAPPLARTEQERLENLTRERQQQSARQARDTGRAATEQRRLEQIREQRCEAAREALQALARQRRRGYTLAEVPGLERREAELLAVRGANC
ncbi:MAG: hypothetical protein KF911_01580 [Pseudomonadales bacterium]|nr:hypothetical protein [Pseudomonadales bacterium]